MYEDTDYWEWFMTYAFEMVLNFIMICSGIQKLICEGGGAFTDTQRARKSHKPTLGK
jgi:hypothetical protein